MTLLHQRYMEFIIKGSQVASGEYQGGVRFLLVETLPQRPNPGGLDHLYVQAALTTSIQHHIMRPPNQLRRCIQAIRQFAKAVPITAGSLLFRAG